MTGFPRIEPAYDDAVFRGMFDAALDPIVVINRAALIRSVNGATGRVFGYTAAELVGRNVSMLTMPFSREAHDAYPDCHRRTGERRIIGTSRAKRRRRPCRRLPMVGRERRAAEAARERANGRLVDVVDDYEAVRKSLAALLDANPDQPRR
jgi:two-component system sensor kinase FixL